MHRPYRGAGFPKARSFVVNDDVQLVSNFTETISKRCREDRAKDRVR